MNKVLTDKEIAKELGLSPWTIRKWRLEGGMPFFQVGHRIFYRYDSVMDWLDEQEKGKPEGPKQYGQIRQIK